MTLYAAWVAQHRWAVSVTEPEPDYVPHGFTGAQGVPLHGWLAPGSGRGTLIATYGITGCLENQGVLRVLGRKAVARGYGVVLFDWRAHGRTAQLSPTLTSDGLYEGEDFLRIADQAYRLGCAPPFWFVGYSLGGQLALWGAKAATVMVEEMALPAGAIAGTIALCPNLDAWRSLHYLMAQPFGRYVERQIARNLKTLAQQIQTAHPGSLDPAAIARADSILAFDRELVIDRLGFPTVQAYYEATSPLGFLAKLNHRTFILYAADDPLFDPSLVPELEAIAQLNPQLDLALTPHGGHVGYLSSPATQAKWGDRDAWWAWNRLFDWIET